MCGRGTLKGLHVKFKHSNLIMVIHAGQITPALITSDLDQTLKRQQILGSHLHKVSKYELVNSKSQGDDSTKRPFPVNSLSTVSNYVASHCLTAQITLNIFTNYMIL